MRNIFFPHYLSGEPGILMLKIMKNMQKSEYDLRLRISNPYMKIMPQHLPC